MSSVELIPHTDPEAARTHFEKFGHVGLTGLNRPAILEPAVADTYALVRKAKPRALGETVARLTSMPHPVNQEALYAVLEGVRQGALLLGRDIAPSLESEEPQVEVLDMMRSTTGRAHVDNPELSDVVAVAGLRGSSKLWFEEGDRTYTINPGDVVLHDLLRNLRHRGSTDSDSERVGLAVAKRQRL